MNKVELKWTKGLYGKNLNLVFDKKPSTIHIYFEEHVQSELDEKQLRKVFEFWNKHHDIGCNNYYSHILTPSDLLKLGNEIVELANSTLNEESNA